MKKFVIIYSVISVALLVFIVVFSAYNQYLARVLDVFSDIAEQAVEDKNFDTFVGFQTTAYEQIGEEVVGDYQFFLYLSLGADEETTIEQLSIYVIPLNDVDFATAIDDENDLTDVKFTNDEGSILYALSEDENFTGEAISYGIDYIGFYYAVMNVESFNNINIEVLDYHGDSIYQTSYDYQANIDLDDPNVSLGLTDEEISVLVDFNTYIRPEILITTSIYLVVDILIGTGLYFYKKKSKKL